MPEFTVVDPGEVQCLPTHREKFATYERQVGNTYHLVSLIDE